MYTVFLFPLINQQTHPSQTTLLHFLTQYFYSLWSTSKLIPHKITLLHFLTQYFYSLWSTSKLIPHKTTLLHFLTQYFYSLWSTSKLIPHKITLLHFLLPSGSGIYFLWFYTQTTTLKKLHTITLCLLHSTSAFAFLLNCIRQNNGQKQCRLSETQLEVIHPIGRLAILLLLVILILVIVHIFKTYSHNTNNSDPKDPGRNRNNVTHNNRQTNKQQEETGGYKCF